MELLPAIDLRNGRVVRLLRGDDAARTAYSDRPVQVLEAFARAGARWIHVVDLDAAFGEDRQQATLRELAAAAEESGVLLQLGGGVRDEAAVEWALAAGCDRVVVGSLLAADPDAFAVLARRWRGRLVPALDVLPDPEAPPGVLAGTVRVAGWREGAGIPLVELCAALRELPCPAVLVTDISRDGTLEGANLDLARGVAAATGLRALLSGGIACLDDLARAAATPGIGGAIVGRALYDGRFSLEDALVACRAGGPARRPEEVRA